MGTARIGLRIKVRLSSSRRNPDEIVFLEEGWNLRALTGSRAWKAMPAFLIRDLDHLRLSKVDMLNYQRRHLAYEDRYRGNSALNRRESKFHKTDLALVENQDVLGALSAIDEFRRGIGNCFVVGCSQPSCTRAYMAVAARPTDVAKFGTSSRKTHFWKRPKLKPDHWH